MAKKTTATAVEPTPAPAVEPTPAPAVEPAAGAFAAFILEVKAAAKAAAAARVETEPMAARIRALAAASGLTAAAVVRAAAGMNTDATARRAVIEAFAPALISGETRKRVSELSFGTGKVAAAARERLTVAAARGETLRPDAAVAAAFGSLDVEAKCKLLAHIAGTLEQLGYAEHAAAVEAEAALL